ncbi:hypothetical protein [Streptomyces sp. NPDC047985]|uniref:hypothetical protein n=1 Tax=Streptomyces sp. NPDC047985 TaxID=3155384 RepID=UPI0034493017
MTTDAVGDTPPISLLHKELEFLLGRTHRLDDVVRMHFFGRNGSACGPGMDLAIDTAVRPRRSRLHRR